jgi:hypothetical protein
MTQYILFIHGNETSNPAEEEWDEFFAAARLSGLFEGGSEIGSRLVLGDSRSAKSSEHIVGYMRFDAADKQELLKLLEKHPVVLHGGTVELCELPRS